MTEHCCHPHRAPAQVRSHGAASCLSLAFVLSSLSCFPRFHDRGIDGGLCAASTRVFCPSALQTDLLPLPCLASTCGVKAQVLSVPSRLTVHTHTQTSLSSPNSSVKLFCLMGVGFIASWNQGQERGPTHPTPVLCPKMGFIQLPDSMNPRLACAM